MCWLAASVAVAGHAAAQPVDVRDETIVYAAEYFAPYTPRTALDMVERVPGFAIDDGEERRGFAGAQGNVLIDGAPPVSKAQDIDDVLARIPAADVIRIELLRGAGSSAGNAQGVRVNLVRRPSSGDGVWELTAERAEDGRVSPSVEAAWSGRARSVEYGVSADLDITRLPIRGERVDRDALGAIDDIWIERIPADEREARISGEMSTPWLGGALSLNAQLSRAEVDEANATRLFDAAGLAAGAVSGALEERETIGEIGAALRRDWGAWSGELAAVITRQRFEADEATAEFEAGGALDEAALQAQTIESGETIVRASAARSLGAWRVKVGAEAALNTLEQDLTLIEDDGSGPAPTPLPSANVRVEEERAELSAMLAGEAWTHWSLEAGVAVETSQLSQSGDTENETRLTYWKPSLQLTRALGGRNQLRFRIYRDVGQLDFEDFVSASDITSAVIDAGNPNLRPETSWRIEAAGDWRFGEGGALSLTLYHHAIEDAFDLVPLGDPGDQLDAPGNIGDAEARGARMSLALPLVFAAELRVEAMVQESEATDPLTGERRSLSGYDESALTVAFRQDNGAWAWGLDYEHETEAASYRLDRIEREQDAEDITLWVETTAFGDVKLRAWGANLSDSADERARRLFDPDRLATFEGSDRRARREGLSFGVSVSGGF